MANAQSQWYAEGLIGALDGVDAKEGEKRIDAFFALLKKRGHHKLLPGIIRAFEVSLQKKDLRNMVWVTVARKEDVHAAAAARKIPPEEILIDETIIGGSVVRTYDTRVDKSYKRALEQLYYRMIET